MIQAWWQIREKIRVEGGGQKRNVSDIKKKIAPFFMLFLRIFLIFLGATSYVVKTYVEFNNKLIKNQKPKTLLLIRGADKKHIGPRDCRLLFAASLVFS